MILESFQQVSADAQSELEALYALFDVLLAGRGSPRELGPRSRLARIFTRAMNELRVEKAVLLTRGRPDEPYETACVYGLPLTSRECALHAEDMTLLDSVPFGHPVPVGEKAIGEFWDGLRGPDATTYLLRPHRVGEPNSVLLFAIPRSVQANPRFGPRLCALNRVLWVFSQCMEIAWQFQHRAMLAHPGPRFFAVLFADIQDSTEIAKSLLPRDYFDLVSSIWRLVHPMVYEEAGGLVGKHPGDGLVAVFPQYELSNEAPALDEAPCRDGRKEYSSVSLCALLCAEKIRTAIGKFTSEWCGVRGYSLSVQLNIGVHCGREYIGNVSPGYGVDVTALGDAMNEAGRLQQFARDGEIWFTRHLFQSLLPEEQRRVSYGIPGTSLGSFEKRFATIRHLLTQRAKQSGNPSGSPLDTKLSQISDLSVARLLSIEE